MFLIKYEEETFEVEFFINLFLFMSKMSKNGDEGCLIIVRNLWCYGSSTSTFDLHWSLLWAFSNSLHTYL